MTLPRERSRSIQAARKFLRSLLDPKQTPRIPKKIRKQAYSVLKHFPADYDIEVISNTIPDTWGPLRYEDHGEDF